MKKIKAYLEEHKEVKDKIKTFSILTLGVMLAAFAFSFFLGPNKLVIGGVSGVGVIIQDLWGFEPSLAMLIVNLGLLLLSLILVGKDFFIKTIYGAVTYPIFSFIFDNLYAILPTDLDKFDFTKLDMMLVILFSSIIMGYGLGLVVKAGGSTGGTEIGQKIFNKTFHFPFSMSLYLIDGTIIMAGFFLMGQDIQTIFYELVFMVVCGFIMDTTIFSGFNKRAVYVISEKWQDVKEVLLKDFARGVTSIKVIGEYSGQDKKMIFCLMSSMEYMRLRNIIEEIDPKAFYYCMRASEVRVRRHLRVRPSQSICPR